MRLEEAMLLGSGNTFWESSNSDLSCIHAGFAPIIGMFLRTVFMQPSSYR